MLGRAVGRYHVVAKLGEGGMGAVWKAEDTVLHRTVALKFLPADLADDVAARRRFLREASATAALQHPHIATLYEIGEHEGDYFLVVAYVEGESLASVLERGPLLECDALRIAAEVADALDHAHERGIVHRDVSPSNVMIQSDGRVVIIDFGVALQEGAPRITSSGRTIGTLAYMAPESLKGGVVDPRADIYALGIVLYQMLTGALPYTGDQPGAVVYAALRGNPERPSTRVANLSPGVDDLVLRAIALDPEKRFASAGEVAQELRRITRGEVGRLDPSATAPKVAPNVAVDGGRRGSVPFHALVVVPELDSTNPEERTRTSQVAEALRHALQDATSIAVLTPPTLERSPATEQLESVRDSGADSVVTVAASREGARVLVKYTLIDPWSEAQIASGTVDGDWDEPNAVGHLLVKRVLDDIPSRHTSNVRARALKRSGSHEDLIRALSHLQRTDRESSVDEAIKILEDLLEREGDTAIVHAALGKAYLHKFGLSKVPLWVRRADAACRRALAADPHSAEVLVTLGRVQTATGNYADATKSFEQSLELHPDQPEAFRHLSTALERLGRYDDALKSAQRSIILRPDFWGGYNRLGALFFRTGRYEEAAHQWRRVVELTPDNAEGHFNLGAACFELGRLEEAERWFRGSIAISETASACTGLGTVLFHGKEREKALDWFERAVRLAPSEPPMWANVGDVSRWVPGLEDKSHEAFDRAIKLLRHRLEINPIDADSWSLLAKCLAKRGVSVESLYAIRRALEIAPDLPVCLARSVTVFHLAGDAHEAVAAFERALRSGCSVFELGHDPELEVLRREETVQRAFANAKSGAQRPQEAPSQSPPDEARR